MRVGAKSTCDVLGDLGTVGLNATSEALWDIGNIWKNIGKRLRVGAQAGAITGASNGAVTRLWATTNAMSAKKKITS